ncbi:Cytosolic seryl-tRNA synthetase [Coemansia sp. S610]|uniref:serine--tRNA ligase n=2 Tax=Coemansia TaxID=4863 RepID=A0A9W8GJC2_9FUNG|nr:Cytosolic seryl-tRNA synthetase [Coemansia sp. RSA 2675]KAJ2022880.1 Cytosolic seryl-tRNA synthetase [Coemansia sp. S85]KAJ2025558.1 Cytosolic seryl-tRNA synthetase [Coemansia sp. S610]KAJ2415751.1 Cytosolic seryl-tRNA synthetase [Coemansia sp. RSA 2530]KAJ2689838.1 Cytosolic seryl-tRNA synthetase [Coemansia spiralis]KAJ2697531.1 Cytosolic seryl-tRNA synthetase [Coemansia sp. IMI 209128]KAJ2792063.1 Cytosolic seryl-tRNA synthetase [Coemansia linderi]
MLDINLFIAEKGGNPELIRESERRRNGKPQLVDEIIGQYQDWTAARFELDAVNRSINATQKEIGQKMKAKEDVAELLVQKKDLESKKKDLAEKEQEKDKALRTNVNKVGNIVHDSVPVSKTEDDNEVIRTYFVDGVEPTHKPTMRSHNEVLYLLGGYDQERGAKVAGHRGYFLTGAGVDLNLALINYGLQFLGKRGYTKIQTPYFMCRDMMAKTAQLSQYDEELYKISGDGDGDDKYLIATSEQPISAFHSGEWFEKPSEQLPLKYAGYSTCFRKEAGAHGKDTWGIFRVHQFEKIEQFVLTEPEKSWEMFDQMIGASEEFFQSLGISYRVVSIVSGALNDAAAKKFDLEAWFPFQGQYKELVSCSNCTDYQSRNLEIRCGTKKMGDREKKYVHCLNSTLCATERALCCLVENYQTPEGLRIPEALIPFMGGVDFIPYVKDTIPKHMKQ